MARALGNLKQPYKYRLSIKVMLVSFAGVTRSHRNPCSSKDKSESHSYSYEFFAKQNESSCFK